MLLVLQFCDDGHAVIIQHCGLFYQEVLKVEVYCTSNKYVNMLDTFNVREMIGT